MEAVGWVVPESYRKLCFGSGGPEPDALDSAIRFEVFREYNYFLSPEWAVFFSKGISIPEKAIRCSLQSAFVDKNELTIRDFYRKFVATTKENFPEDLLEHLKNISLEHAYPKECGLVAIAASVRDFARPEVIEVAPHKNKLTVSMKNIDGKFCFANPCPGMDYSWLRLI